jgi:hypothetical protein
MKIIVIIICALLIVPYSYADTPQCAKIQVKILTNDNKMIEGFYYYYGMYSFEIFGNNPDSISFKKILEEMKNYNYKDTIEIYNNIIKLNIMKCGNANYYACKKSDVIKLDYKDIKIFNQLEIYTCHSEDSLNKYYPAGCPPEIITELTDKEIELINSTQGQMFKLDDIAYFFDQLCSPVLISYNTMMTKDEIIELIKKYTENQEYSDHVYMKLKKELNDRKIIIFKTLMYN